LCISGRFSSVFFFGILTHGYGLSCRMEGGRENGNSPSSQFPTWKQRGSIPIDGIDLSGT
jgi:hypothetical protein